MSEPTVEMARWLAKAEAVAWTEEVDAVVGAGPWLWTPAVAECKTLELRGVIMLSMLTAEPTRREVGTTTVVLTVVTEVSVACTVVVLETVDVVEMVVVMLSQGAVPSPQVAVPAKTLNTSRKATTRARCTKTRGGRTAYAAPVVVVVVLAGTVAVVMVTVEAAWWVVCLEWRAVDMTMGEALSEDNEGRASVVLARVVDRLLENDTDDKCMPDAMNVEMLM
jgi:hypothetical protein